MHATVVFLTPAPRAALWGSPVSVGLRVTGGVPVGATLHLGVLELPTGKVNFVRRGIHHEVCIELDCTTLPDGGADLSATVQLANGGTATTEPVPVRIVHPAEGTAQFHEAEALSKLPLPEKWRYKAQGGNGRDNAASGKVFVAHNGGGTASRVPVERDTDTWWQVIVRARGNYVGGALPSVGVYLDDERDKLLGETQLVTDGWHRLVIASPVRVPAGEHWLGVRFTNDRYVAKLLDRNLHVDSVEVLPLADADMSDVVPSPDGVYIVPKQTLDGMTISGPFDWGATVVRQDYDKTPPSPVMLELNGEEIGRQYSDNPRFRVGAQRLRNGENTIRAVVETADGARTATHRSTFTWHGRTGEAARVDDLLRITVSEPGWTGDGADTLSRMNGAPDTWRFGMSRNSTVAHALPAGLQGRYQLFVFAHSDEFEGFAKCQVKLDDKELKTIDVRPGWRANLVDTIDLDTSAADTPPPVISAAFINDHYEKDKGDRNLHISAIELRRIDPRKDNDDVALTWHYPAAGATIARTDAVVVDASGDGDIAWIALDVDGKEWPGAVYTPRSADSRVALPFVLRGVEPGEHALRVRVGERSGRVTTSQPVTVLLADDAAGPGVSPYAAAVHFLNRFAHGPESRLLADVLIDGIEPCLRRWLAAGPDEEALAIAKARYWRDDNNTHISYRPLDIAMWTQNPVRHRLVMFHENHFSTFIEKANAFREWAEYMRFERLAAGHFGDLLRASATSPCMLFYLDQTDSFANRINENYAREIMELHTLGVDGGYTQADVEALTRVLTGWSSTRDGGREQFAFCPELHDMDARTVVGMHFDAIDPKAADAAAQALDRGQQAIEMLLAHPGTARFIARKMVAHWVQWPAPQPMVDVIATRFMETDGDMVELMVALAKLLPQSPTTQGTDPLEFGLRICRTADHRPTYLLANLLQATERLPMRRVTPDGYPEADPAWFDSAAMLNRWRFAEDCANAIRYRWFHGSARRNQREYTDEYNQSMLDTYAVHLTGGPLGEESNRVALEIMRAASGDVNQRTGLAASIVGQMPEANEH
ncbi:MAG: DUF1800 family protein [Planctomycetota bacterium]